MPDSLSDGDITSARIIVDGNEFKSENFVFGEKTSSSPITVFSRLRGKVEAHKQEETNRRLLISPRKKIILVKLLPMNLEVFLSSAGQKLNWSRAGMNSSLY